jgi:hypothetical protein
MKQEMTVTEALLYADGAHDNGLRTETDVALAVLAAEVRRLTVALNRQAQVTEKAIEAMNRNADRGEKAEAEAKRYRWLRDVGDATWVPMAKRPGVNFTHEIDAAIDKAMKP